MISISAYEKSDLLLIRSHLLILIVCLVLIGGIFWATNYIDSAAATELRQARSQMDNIRSAMARIQAEEATASKYIDKYQSLQTGGVIGAEDRLQLLESLARIRAQHELFPISINIREQAELTLPYENHPDGAGPPVKLRSSILEINFPLLHEEDLSRLLDDLLGTSHLLQPANCKINANNETSTTFYYLDKHFTASCSMYWYTFDVTAAAEAQP